LAVSRLRSSFKGRLVPGALFVTGWLQNSQ